MGCHTGVEIDPLWKLQALDHSLLASSDVWGQVMRTPPLAWFVDLSRQSYLHRRRVLIRPTPRCSSPSPTTFDRVRSDASPVLAYSPKPMFLARVPGTSSTPLPYSLASSQRSSWRWPLKYTRRVSRAVLVETRSTEELIDPIPSTYVSAIAA